MKDLQPSKDEKESDFQTKNAPKEELKQSNEELNSSTERENKDNNNNTTPQKKKKSDIVKPAKIVDIKEVQSLYKLDPELMEILIQHKKLDYDVSNVTFKAVGTNSETQKREMIGMRMRFKSFVGNSLVISIFLFIFLSKRVKACGWQSKLQTYHFSIFRKRSHQKTTFGTKEQSVGSC